MEIPKPDLAYEKINKETDIDTRIRKKIDILSELENGDFSSLWLDVTPSDWVKWVPIINAVLLVILMIVVFIKH